MDSTADPAFDWKPYEELRKNLPSAYPPMTYPQATPEDRRSFQRYREWQRRVLGIAFPESDLRAVFAASPDGSVGPYMSARGVGNAIHDGMHSPDYSRIRVPVLAFFSLPKALEVQLRLYPPNNEKERNAIEQVYAADMSYVKGSIARLRTGVPDARVVELVGANHYIFLANEPEVLREIRAFLATLH